MNVASPFFWVLGGSSLCFVVAGLLMLWKPPATINALYGYRTPRSMQSPEAWQFAQRYSAIRMVRYSAVALVLSLVGLILNWHPLVETGLALVLMLVPVGIMLFETERELKSRFGPAEPEPSGSVESS